MSRRNILGKTLRNTPVAVSLVLHVAVIALLLLAASLAPPIAEPHRVVVPLWPVTLPDSVSRPGSPGRSAPEGKAAPPRQGSPPKPKPAREFLPPKLAHVEAPALPIEASAPEALAVTIELAGVGHAAGVAAGVLSGLIGDMGAFGSGLKGPGGGSGGEGDGTGDGDSGGGAGGLGFYSGGVTRAPELIYKEEPEYSEEARKARLQGRVILRIDVGLDGRPANIRVLRGVGLGLDENAIEAVRKWRFRPAQAGDEPVVSPATIEVGFRLL